VNRHPSPSEATTSVTTALDRCADPVAAVLAAYRAGERISVPTSGTTGRPRRIVRTAASWVDSFAAVAGLTDFTRASRAWVPGPLAATMNLFAATLVSHLGAELVSSPTEATHAFLTPSGLRGLLAEPVTVGGLRVIVAGDRLRPDLADRAEARGWLVSHYYGAAQLSFVAWGRDEASLRPFPKVRLWSRDGELWVASPWLCEQEITASGVPATLRSFQDPTTEETWASVGDRGRVTADGRVLVGGRDGVILTGGATVIAGDVEAALRQAARGEVFLVPQPHPRLGALVVAVCTDHDDLSALPRYARAALSGAYRPRRWLHLPDPPLTAAGKVDRAALATWVAER
jgi:long-chain acyl-CoA synthetase